MKLGLLTFRTKSHLTQLKELVAAAGHTVEEVLAPEYRVDTEEDRKVFAEGWKATWAHVEALVAEADALYLSTFFCFKTEHGEQLLSKLHKRVASGARLILTDDPNALVEQNQFLAFYGIAFTPIVLYGDDTTLRILRSHKWFRDPALFAAVPQIALDWD